MGSTGAKSEVHILHSESRPSLFVTVQKSSTGGRVDAVTYADLRVPLAEAKKPNPEFNEDPLVRCRAAAFANAKNDRNPPIVLKNFAAQETARKFGTSFSQAAFLQIAFGKGGFGIRVFCRSASNWPDADIFKTMLTIFPTFQRIMAVIVVQS